MTVAAIIHWPWIFTFLEDRVSLQLAVSDEEAHRLSNSEPKKRSDNDIIAEVYRQGVLCLQLVHGLARSTHRASALRPLNLLGLGMARRSSASSWPSVTAHTLEGGWKALARIVWIGPSPRPLRVYASAGAPSSLLMAPDGPRAYSIFYG